MGQVYFYHLTRSPLEPTLRQLLERALQAGWRVAVRARTEALLDHLDAELWREPVDGFLPHGRAGGPHDAAQPVLLTTDAGGMANDPACLVSVEGAGVEAGEAARMARVLVLFDGRSEAAMQTARAQWTALTAAGLSAVYWSEETGRWQKKAESAGTA